MASSWDLPAWTGDTHARHASFAFKRTTAVPFKTSAPETVSLRWHGDGRQGCVCGIWVQVFHSRELTLKELVMLHAADVILTRWRLAIAAAESMPRLAAI
eukprot:1788330-Prymnesium_polylepis.1